MRNEKLRLVEKAPMLVGAESPSMINSLLAEPSLYKESKVKEPVARFFSALEKLLA